MDHETRSMLRTSLVHLLADSDESALAPRLEALGWAEVIEDDRPAAIRTLFESRGLTLSSADALTPVTVEAVAVCLKRPDLAGAGLILPASLHPNRWSSRDDGSRFLVDGVSLSPLGPGQPVIIPIGGPPGLAGLAVTAAAAWTLSPHDGFDSASGGRVQVKLPRSDIEWIDGTEALSAWETATVTARVALAAELVAIGRSVVRDAVDYTGQRRQYGRAIGSFQALQHRLASAYASVVGAGDVADEASESGRPWDALVAKALAGRAAEFACTQAQQSYGAIGFTWEHPFHRHLRRTYLLDRLWGDWRTLETEIGAAVMTTKQVPKVGSL